MDGFKYVSNIENKGGRKVVDMHIYTHIGKGGVTATEFVNEMKAQKANRINVRVNTVGGNVVEGFGIFSAMVNFKNSGGELHTYNDGLAASTGGWLLMAADAENRHSKDFAILMLHAVKGDVEGNLFEKSILNIFSKTTGLVVKELMNNGKDNFFDAEEAAEAGFFPSKNIESTGLSIDLPENCTLFEVSNELERINKDKIIINKIPLRMETVINILKLQAGSNEQVIAQAVQNALDATETAQAAKLTAENALKESETTITELKAKVETANKATGTAYVEAQVLAGRFTPADNKQKDALISQYMASPENFIAMVAMMPTKAVNAIDAVTTPQAGADSVIAKVNNRSFRELEKTDSNLLIELKNKAIGTYTEMYNLEYGTNKLATDF